MAFMNFRKESDKRLIDRAERQGHAAPAELARVFEDLPDLSDQRVRPVETDVDSLRQEFSGEAERRREAIERQLREPPKPQIQVRPVPLPEFED
jgi:hypothetical protein